MMQFIKKPKIDLVLKAQKGAVRQEKDRFTDRSPTHSCLKDFKTANFETRNPKMRFFIPYITSTLSDNICKVEEPGLTFLQPAKKNPLDFNPQLTENRLHVVNGQATEYCSLPFDPGSRELTAIKRC